MNITSNLHISCRQQVMIWKTKVIVIEKQSSKPSRQGNGRYKHLMLIDTQGNTIQASLYDSNITAFEDQLVLEKTYTISKAYVKNNTINYRYSIGSLQWTISGETHIKELNEDNLDFLQIRTAYVQKKENLMAHFKFADILAIAIDMTPKRLIQSKDGNQTWLEDIILLDMNFKTMMLTLWDSFVDREYLLIADIIDKKLVIFATRLKITSFFGLKLSTKFRSTFFINTPFNAVKQMTEWVRTNSIKIDDFVLKKSYMDKSPTNLSLSVRSKFTPIQNLQGRILTVILRARAYVQLSDVTGSISANAIGEPAKKLLFTTSQSLMEETKSDTERAFYLKVSQNEPNSSSYRFDIISVTGLDHPSPGQEIQGNIDHTSLEPKIQTNVDSQIVVTAVGKNVSTDYQEDWSPPAKKALIKSSNDSSSSKVACDENISLDTNPFAHKEKME
ncbi:uncharacterized protein LOC111396422 [Olea europaea var. sylvestris]|uniref:uncharacterized protein LOC111396422 n=1 Tax=Olea europaea var. sylvestris TaxID=158386 RepID=UPI000C1D4004|nr:uncharacterized protein LOC111396422 [Olea europaea var. sylvestris]